MAERKTYRPSGWESLEERAVLSHAGGIHAAIAPPLLGIGVATPVTVGALGDSYTDEYRFYPPDQSQARNWVEILSATQRVNFGTFGKASRGEPRDQGFAYNWARNGSTTSDLVANQLPGLAAQVARGQVHYAWIFSGGNDFLYFLQGAQDTNIAQFSGLLTQLTQVEARAEANFTTAVDTLLAASPKVKLVVATVPDVASLPIVGQAIITNPEAQALVFDTGLAIQQYDTRIRSIAASNPRIALADLAAESASLGGLGGSVPFGGTTIDLTTPGDDYHHFFLADRIHVGTVGQGIIADAFVNAIDTQFHAHVNPLSAAQIVSFARHVKPGTP